MLSPRSILAKLMLLAVALSWAAQVRALPNYYSDGVGSTQACTACHSPTVTTATAATRTVRTGAQPRAPSTSSRRPARRPTRRERPSTSP